MKLKASNAQNDKRREPLLQKYVNNSCFTVHKISIILHVFLQMHAHTSMLCIFIFRFTQSAQVQFFNRLYRMGVPFTGVFD
jgi:hypothetical protein